jgi:hypothetical protein
MLTYPSRPPANTPLCLHNARIIGPARHVNGDGSPCTQRLGSAPAVSRDACAGWPGPPAASSWKTQLSLSWGNQRQFDEVLRAVVKVGGTQDFFFVLVCLGLRADVFVARVAAAESAEGPRLKAATKTWFYMWGLQMKTWIYGWGFVRTARRRGRCFRARKMVLVAQ